MRNVQNPLRLMVLGGAALSLLAGALWWNCVYHNPTNVFWGMINGSLRTSGVTRTVSESSGGQKIEQLQQVQLGGTNRVRTLTTLSQSGSKVVTETLSTPGTDYVRYDSFKTTQKSQNGKPLDFKGVTGVWAKSSPGAQFGRTVFGLVPMAAVSSENRQKLVEQIKNSSVFTGDIKNAKSATVAGHKVYVYDLKLQPVAYVAYLKSLSADLGLRDFDNVDPGQYSGASAQALRLAVDMNSRQVVQAEYVAARRTETYSSYGVKIASGLPAKTIPDKELQARLQKLFQ